MIIKKAQVKVMALKANAGHLDGWMIRTTRRSNDGGCVTHLELFDIDTGVVGETFRVGDLDVGFLQFVSQIVPHLGEKQRRRDTRVNSSNSLVLSVL